MLCGIPAHGIIFGIVYKDDSHGREPVDWSLDIYSII